MDFSGGEMILLLAKVEWNCLKLSTEGENRVWMLHACTAKMPHSVFKRSKLNRPIFLLACNFTFCVCRLGTRFTAVILCFNYTLSVCT